MVAERAIDASTGFRRALESLSLTKREAQIALLVAWHHTNAEAAGVLGISVAAIKRHLERLFPKLEVENRRQLGARVLAILQVSRDGSRVAESG